LILPFTVTIPDIANAVRDNNWTLFQTLGKNNSSFKFIDRDGLSLRIDEHLPHLVFNGVWRTNMKSHDLRQHIERVKEVYKKLDRIHYWRVWSADYPEELQDVLEESGYSLMAELPGMFIKIKDIHEEKILEEGFVISSVKTKHNLEIWKKVVVEVFGPDFEPIAAGYVMAGIDEPLHHYIGWSNGEPVALSSVCYGDGVAGIYAVATRSDYRGRGFGRAMTLKALYDAKDRGYEIGVLTSSKLGQPLYQQIGFETCCSQKIYKSNEH
jgi:ribosomal protein S18 acetylase RimI-like enzyme